MLDREKFGAIMKQVAFHAGDDYVAAVELCFFPIVDDIVEDEDPDASLQTQEEIVQKLSKDVVQSSL